jgi:hypothetical protein
MSAKRGDSLLLEHIFKCAKRIYAIPKFTLYAVADGISEILAKSGIIGVTPNQFKTPHTGVLS